MSEPAARTRNLSRSLALGAVYDFLLALAILVADGRIMKWLHFPPPADLFLFRLSALPPLLFPIVYLAAAQDPAGRPWAVRASILLRIFGGIALGLIAVAHRPPGLHVYVAAALIDLVWAAIYMLLWIRGRPESHPAA